LENVTTLLILNYLYLVYLCGRILGVTLLRYVVTNATKLNLLFSVQTSISLASDVCNLKHKHKKMFAYCKNICCSICLFLKTSSIKLNHHQVSSFWVWVDSIVIESWKLTVEVHAEKPVILYIFFIVVEI